MIKTNNKIFLVFIYIALIQLLTIGCKNEKLNIENVFEINNSITKQKLERNDFYWANEDVPILTHNDFKDSNGAKYKISYQFRNYNDKYPFSKISTIEFYDKSFITDLLSKSNMKYHSFSEIDWEILDKDYFSGDLINENGDIFDFGLYSRGLNKFNVTIGYNY